MRVGICTQHDLITRLAQAPVRSYFVSVYYWHTRINCPVLSRSAAFTTHLLNLLVERFLRLRVYSATAFLVLSAY